MTRVSSLFTRKRPSCGPPIFSAVNMLTMAFASFDINIKSLFIHRGRHAFSNNYSEAFGS